MAETDLDGRRPFVIAQVPDSRKLYIGFPDTDDGYAFYSPAEAVGALGVFGGQIAGARIVFQGVEEPTQELIKRGIDEYIESQGPETP